MASILGCSIIRQNIQYGDHVYTYGPVMKQKKMDEILERMEYPDIHVLEYLFPHDAPKKFRQLKFFATEIKRTSYDRTLHGSELGHVERSGGEHFPLTFCAEQSSKMIDNKIDSVERGYLSWLKRNVQNTPLIFLEEAKKLPPSIIDYFSSSKQEFDGNRYGALIIKRDRIIQEFIASGRSGKRWMESPLTKDLHDTAQRFVYYGMVKSKVDQSKLLVDLFPIHVGSEYCFTKVNKEKDKDDLILRALFDQSPSKTQEKNIAVALYCVLKNGYYYKWERPRLHFLVSSHARYVDDNILNKIPHNMDKIRVVLKEAFRYGYDIDWKSTREIIKHIKNDPTFYG